MLSNVKNELELLERHVRILREVMDTEPIGIIKLAEQTGIPQHRVRYSLRVLESKGFIKPSAQGALSTRKAKKLASGFKKDLQEIKEDVQTLMKVFD